MYRALLIDILTKSNFMNLFLKGVKDLAPPLWTLSAVAQEKEGSYPVLLLLSPGADPCPELSLLAAKHVSSSFGFIEVSLGQGHITQAESALEAACR